MELHDAEGQDNASMLGALSAAGFSLASDRRELTSILLGWR
jgi:hypothetical protein